MKNITKHLFPETISETIRLLNEAPNHSCIIAGGTDILLDLRQSPHSQINTLIDVNNIPALQKIYQEKETLFVGAAVPLNKVFSSPLVQTHAEALSDACRLIGGPQVRNVATLGGNVGHALPAADGTISLMALDALAVVAGQDGVHNREMKTLFSGPGMTALKHNEFIIGFYLSLKQPNQASAFRRVMRPQGVALPIINMAVWLEREQSSLKSIRIAIGPSGPVPGRAYQVETFFVGKIYKDELIEEASSLLAETIHFRTSRLRATSEYRNHLCQYLLRETLEDAWQRTF
jgi:CO/xanthine dehydrogenase FAD-binding subunit